MHHTRSFQQNYCQPVILLFENLFVSSRMETITTTSSGCIHVGVTDLNTRIWLRKYKANDVRYTFCSTQSEFWYTKCWVLILYT